MTVRDDRVAPSPGPAADARPGRVARVRDALFPAAPERRRRGSYAAWAGVLVAAAVYQAFRTPGPGALDSVWAEDGANFLNDAANDGTIAAISRPVNGYYLLYPRLLAEVTTLFPVSWWAVVNTLFAIATTCAMAAIVYRASAGQFRRRDPGFDGHLLTADIAGEIRCHGLQQAARPEITGADDGNHQHQQKKHPQGIRIAN